MAKTNGKRYGLIGTGPQGEDFIQVVAALPDAELVAICEPEDAPLNRALERLRSLPASPSIFTSWQDMVSNVKLDALILARGQDENHNILPQLTKRPIPMLVSAPISPTVRGGMAMVKQMRAARVPFQIGLQGAADPVIDALIDEANTAQTGPLIQVKVGQSAHLPYPADAETERDWVFALVHSCDLVARLAPERPVRVHVSLPTPDPDAPPSEQPVPAQITFDYREGGHAFIDLQPCAPGEARVHRLIFAGTKLRLDGDLDAGQLVHGHGGAPAEPIDDLPEVRALPESMRGKGRLIAAFQRALNGEDTETADAVISLRAHALALAVVSAIRYKKPQKVPEWLSPQKMR
ncbi:MAG: Gfo/Idh/MocA family oxidoreductase [Pseudomonadota bacterium]